jgi:hypothetical protein
MKETMLTVFFTFHKLLVPNPLPNGEKYNQHDFIRKVIPELQGERP